MADTWPAGPSRSRSSQASLEALFSYGFRPFFLAASVYAAVAMAVWLLWIAISVTGASPPWIPADGPPLAWHAHEMLFGFAAAAVAGFLLTAVPNWTGALPLSGAPLALLFVIWLAGRFAMGLSGHLPAALVAATDLAFLPLLGAFAARQLLVKPAARNLIFLAILALMTTANAVFHLAAGGIMDLDPLAAMRVDLLLLVLMLAIIGGRIVPAFTHNWLHLHAPSSKMPRRIGWLDASSISSIVLLALLYVAGAPDAPTGAVALAAGLLNGVRLHLWHGWSTRREPIVWVLHLAYAWIVVGLLLTAIAALTSFVEVPVAFHALATGAVGTMIMAVMSRASLGHTGRPLVAPKPVVCAYVLITLAALLRVVGPVLAPQLYAELLTLSALAWFASFGLFAVVYAPILTTPRVHMKAATP